MKGKLKQLRKSYEALMWCEMQQDKAAADGAVRFRGEPFAEFFERVTGAHSAGID